MDENSIFPKLREDIFFHEIEQDGQDLVVIADPYGYASQQLAIPVEMASLLSLFDGKTKVSDLKREVIEQQGIEPNLTPVYSLMSYLDSAGYLANERYEVLKNEFLEYQKSSSRPSVCAGNTFPDDPGKLAKELDKIIGAVPKTKINGKAKAIIVPHIDFRIGKGAHQAYAAGYRALANTNPDLFIILGTSHHANSDLFMFTKKDFETPLGKLKTDKDLLDKLDNELSFDLTFDDMAHRYEHSVELQMVLIQRIFAGKDFTVLPILTGSLHKFIYDSSLPSTDVKFLEFTRKLTKLIEQEKRNAVFIASADFAHIGRKFEDDFDAEPKLPQLKIEDEDLIDSLTRCDPEQFSAKSPKLETGIKFAASPLFTHCCISHGRKKLNS